MSMYELCLHTNVACQQESRVVVTLCFSLKEMLFINYFCLSQKGSSTKVGAVHGMSEESLPDGCSNSGQKKVP